MEKHYYIHLQDLKDMKFLEKVDIFFKDQYVRIITQEDSYLDKIMVQLLEDGVRHPYFIRRFLSPGDEKEYCTTYGNLDNLENSYLFRHMFRQWVREKEVFLHKEDYEKVKQEMKIYEVGKVKGEEYYKINIKEDEVIPTLKHPYFSEGKYYNIYSIDGINLLDKIRWGEIEEM